MTVRSKDTGYVRTTTTRVDGRFQVIAMPVGSYSIEASLSGQAPAKRDGVVLSVGATRRPVTSFTTPETAPPPDSD